MEGAFTRGRYLLCARCEGRILQIGGELTCVNCGHRPMGFPYESVPRHTPLPTARALMPRTYYVLPALAAHGTTELIRFGRRWRAPRHWSIPLIPMDQFL